MWIKTKNGENMKKEKGMPDLVYWGLWGINSKRTAYVFVAISLLLGIGSVAYGFKDPRAFIGAIFFIATIWYIYSIRWVDKNSTWKSK